MLDAHRNSSYVDDEHRAGSAIGHQLERPTEAPPTEWAKWSEATRYVYVERLGISDDKYIALKEARANHESERPRLFQDRQERNTYRAGTMVSPANTPCRQP